MIFFVFFCFLWIFHYILDFYSIFALLFLDAELIFIEYLRQNNTIGDVQYLGFTNYIPCNY